MFNNELWQKPTAAGAAGFYTHQIANSIRADTNNGYLHRTPSGAGDRDTWTFSTWIKLAQMGTGTRRIYSAGSSGDQDGFYTLFYNANKLVVSSANANFVTPSDTFRDPSAWYHIVWKQGSNATTLYVNGSQIATASVSGNTAVNNNTLQCIGTSSFGGSPTNGEHLDGYFAETIMIDGTALDPDSFGETKNGVWIPKDASGLTYGTNGFRLTYGNASDLGEDSAGSNDWTAVNLATHDQMLDTPTFNSSSNGGNFATLGGLEKNTGGFTISEGNLKYAVSTNNRGFIASTGVPESGKYYWEVRVTQFGGSEDQVFPGVCVPDKMRSNLTGSRGGADVSGAGGYTVDNYNGRAMLDGVAQSNDAIGNARSVPQTFGIAIDRDNNTFKWTYDGSTYSSTYTIPSSGVLAPFLGSGGGSNTASGVFNFGADSTFAGLVSAGGNADGNGYGDFSLAVPSGYVALCAANLPVADAVDPAQTDDDYPKKLFGLGFWSGSGSQQTVSGVGLQPDLFWNLRDRRYSQNNYWVDSSRGLTGSNSVFIETNSTDAEEDFPQDNIVSVNSDGFVISDGTWLNSSGGHMYMAICSRYNGGTTASNSNGSVTSTTQVDPSGHASIVQWAGTNDSWGNAITVGHGLSTTPAFIISKNRSKADEWSVFLDDYGGTTIGGSNAASNSLVLNTNAAVYTNQSYKGYGGTMPTSTVFTVDGNNLNGVDSGGSGENIVAYCFARCAGWIDVQVYKGNGNVDGPYISLNNTPAYVWIKRLDSTGAWVYFVKNQKTTATSSDTTFNSDKRPHAWHNLSDAPEYSDTSNNNIDILAQAIKIREDNSSINADGGYYMVFAIAEQPSKYAVAQ